MQEDLHIYFLPGMGADKRLYDPMEIPVGTHHYIEWEHLPHARTMADYAEHLCSQIQTDNNVYIGSSMGGMMAVEMQYIKPADQLILLSAPASRKEFPPILNTMDRLQMGRWLNKHQVYRLNRLADTFMGFKTEEDRRLFYEMLENYGPDFLYFAVNAILGWKRSEAPKEYLQIIGSNDRLFKQKRMRSPEMIHGAGHFMTFEQPARISEIIVQRLTQQVETL